MNEVIRVSEKTKQKLIDYYQDKKKDKVIPYVVFQAVDMDTVVTLYESGKVMFQGKSADVDAAMWREIDGQNKVDKQKIKEEEKKFYYCTSIGSDEVGTGDYFGPIVVTSCYVQKEDIPFLEELGIRDSKKMSDEKILKIAPKIAQKIPYKSVILSNHEYNEKYTQDVNMNKIKALLHNRVLHEIQKEHDTFDYMIVDEFAREKRYYEYLRDAPFIQRGITFMTKAEDKNLAVASASIISRYLFLKEMDKLSDALHIPLPKGAGVEVDKVGEEIVEKFGEEKLQEIAKMNFKNTQKILHTLLY